MTIWIERPVIRQRRHPFRTVLIAAILLLASVEPALADPRVYSNPLAPVIPGSEQTVESCADPIVLRGQKPGDDFWYMYCTTDPLHGADVDEAGEFVFRRIPQLRSVDLVNWEYVGDAFPQGEAGLPGYAEADAALWAPDIVYSEADNGDGDGQYLLFFGVTDTTPAVGGDSSCGSDGAIGVATSETPVGPWRFAERPVVEPRRGGPGCDFKWTFDPDVLGERIGAAGVFYYGSYYGGIFGAELTLEIDGDPATPDGASLGEATMVAIDNRYEGANVVERDGWYYMFASSADCCNGALTGYTTFVGRSDNPLGPFVDRQGNSLLDAAAGGTPFLVMNGNRWVGTGHNSVFQDAAGAWWTAYHAVDREDPFFPGEIAEGERGFTKRPVLLDAVEFVDGWPVVNGGAGPSDAEMPAPVGRVSAAVPLPEFSEEFDGSELAEGWGWDGGAMPEHSVADGVLRVAIQTADTYVDVDTASVLLRDAPEGDFVVETKVRTTVPDTGCCYNFAQAGVGIYGDEDNLVKLTATAIFNTRQTEWAKEVGADRVEPGWARYGNAVIGPPSEEWTYLRIVVEEGDGETRYTGYSSQDGSDWVRGATWTHELGDPKVALFAMGLQPSAEGEAAQEFVAEFDHVRVSRVEGQPLP